MSETRDRYERAVKYRDSLASKIKGGMTQSVQGKLDDATDEVIKFRNKLIEEGNWDGPIPIPVRQKYRGK